MATWQALLAASGLARSEAQWLASHVAGRPRSWLLAHADEEAEAAVAQAVRKAFARRCHGEPMAYITGEREFYSLAFQVTPAVLIPRPETEQLVELALARLPRGGRLLDIGTGSGAIAIALAHTRPDAQVLAGDISPAALQVAQANASRLGVNVAFRQSDGLQGFASESFDVITSNPPYIAEGDPHLGEGDVRFEPRLALTSGADGLRLIRQIAADARAHLAPDGWLMFEHGHDQGPACAGLLATLGYTEVADLADLAGLPRVCLGKWPGKDLLDRPHI